MTSSSQTVPVDTESQMQRSRTRWRTTSAVVLLGLLAGCGDTPPAQTKKLAAQGIYTGALSNDSQYALVGSLNHGASLWNASDHERLYNWSHEAGKVTDLVAAGFSPDGSRAVTTDPRTLVVWDTASGSALAYWTTPAAVLDVSVLAGDRVLMGLKDHSAVLFDAESGDHLHTLLHEGVVGSVAATDDGRLALTGSDDETARIWSLETGEQLALFQHDNPVRVVALSSSGRLAFSAAQHQRVVVWDPQTGATLQQLSKRNTGITSARFSDDEKLLLLGYVNRRVELWNVDQGRLVDSWDAKARNPWHTTGAAILAVGFKSNRQFYALAGDGRLVELIPG